ncbi:MAG: GNAT family N-acetyltransferase/peptidase C39 family protein [Aestuariibacter sp.]
MSNASNITVRPSVLKDLNALVSLEQACFSTDRLSQRSMRHYIKAEHSELLVAEKTDESGDTSLLGYGLIWCHKGTRLARLYSLAVHPQARGLGLAGKLMDALEQQAAHRGRLFMRLEVAENNEAAIQLYKKRGYRIFGEYNHYYADQSDALRMQKTIRHGSSEAVRRNTPWFQQTTDFSCGPASLMMAMASLNESWQCEQGLELDLWREATSIFMTSGHGGCHPFGLALAAQSRGFNASVMVNQQGALFLDGVRNAEKKQVMQLVHEQFLARCQQAGVSVEYDDLTQQKIEIWLQDDYAVLMLISTYRLDGKKAPHWVVVTGMDDHCFYLHDPDVDEQSQLAIDCQHVPIARSDVEKMSAFGSNRLRAAVAIKQAAAS